MFHFLINLLRGVLFLSTTKRKDLLFTLLLLRKENEIYRRHLNLRNERLQMRRSDRLSLSLLLGLSKRVISHLTIVKPRTLLDWQRQFIKNFWTYKHKKSGRKPVSAEIKNLILEMKLNNQIWGCHRIADELNKLEIRLHPTTVNRILQTHRKNGKIQSVGSWSKFLKMHWDSLFAMDFMTIDTLFGKRLYLFLVLQLKTRKIAHWSLTEYPTREYVKQQLIDFSERYSRALLIHDNAPQFSIDFSLYGLKGKNIAIAAPNMNAFVERVFGSVRREALDHFLIISTKQVLNILREYIEYYNYQRPHQGIDRIPGADNEVGDGVIRKNSVLSGLHHHYYRSSA